MSEQKSELNNLDIRIGKMIAVLRRRQGLTQQDMAQRLGVTFQQIQKYESASNKISASRLYQIAAALDLQVAALFGDAIKSDNQTYNFITQILQLNDSDRKIIKTLITRLNNK